MISNVALKEEDFLQQFPQVKEYMQDGLAFADWWDAGEDRATQGQSINVTNLFATNKGIG